MSRILPLGAGAALSAVSAGLSVAGYRRAVAAGLDPQQQRVRLQRTLAKVAIDLFFAWRLARLARRDGG